MPDFDSSISGVFIDCSCKVLVIDTDAHFRYVILNSLKYFSFNGRELEIIETSSLDEAKRYIADTDDVILVVFNKMSFGINGNSDFTAILKDYIENKNGRVIFRYNGVSSKPFMDMTSSSMKLERESQFEYARDRLVDLVQMAIVTYNNNNHKTPDTGDYLDSNNAADTYVSKKGSQNNIGINDDNATFPLTGGRLFDMLANGLKGPIGNIKVLMDALTNAPELFDEETSYKLLSNVRSSADSMNELIDSFLFWSRIRKNELEFNPIRINVKNLILENINLLKGTAAQKEIELKFDMPDEAVAFADEVMMITVLRNLIYNAIKFTERGGRVLLKVRCEGDFVKICIDDTGVGIPAENIDKLFDADAHISTKGTEGETGSGLGLLLCKDYVEKNGGNISVESEVGKGSKFRFTVPQWKSMSRN